MIKWSDIFKEHKPACYEFYKWVSKNPDYLYNFNEPIFFDMLISNGYMGNMERVFEFFDAAYIRCYVAPISYKYFTGHSMSEYRTIKCHDFTSRREAVSRVIENGFDLLDERISFSK